MKQDIYFIDLIHGRPTVYRRTSIRYVVLAFSYRLHHYRPLEIIIYLKFPFSRRGLTHWSIAYLFLRIIQFHTNKVRH